MLAEERRQKGERLARASESELPDRTQRYLGHQGRVGQFILTPWSAVQPPGGRTVGGPTDLGRAEVPLSAGEKGRRAGGPEAERESVPPASH